MLSLLFSFFLLLGPILLWRINSSTLHVLPFVLVYARGPICYLFSWPIAVNARIQPKLKTSETMNQELNEAMMCCSWSLGPQYNNTSEDCLYLNVFSVNVSTQITCRHTRCCGTAAAQLYKLIQRASCPRFATR